MLHAAAIAAVKPHQADAQDTVAAFIKILTPLLSSLGERDAGSAVTLHIF
jgi:hypothetical protein